MSKNTERPIGTPRPSRLRYPTPAKKLAEITVNLAVITVNIAVIIVNLAITVMGLEEILTRSNSQDIFHALYPVNVEQTKVRITCRRV